MSGADNPVSVSRGGLFSSLRRLAGTGIGIVQTRLEILSSELEEERSRLGSILITCALALFGFFGAAVLFTVLIVVLLWDQYRVHALVALGLLFLLGGVSCWLSLRRQLRERPRFLAATLGEFGKDKRELSSR
jgi:uncharacterized membrane protein YqjE